MMRAVPRRTFQVPRGAPPRLDQWLARDVPGVTLERARKWLAEGRVRVNGKVPKAARRLWGGEDVELDEPELAKPRAIDGPPIPVLFEDARLLIVNKAPGVVVEPDGHNPSLVELLAGKHEGLSVEGQAAPGVVHRLDKETSGCVVLAKTDAAVKLLLEAFEAKRIDKRYVALVLGSPPDTGRLDTPFGRLPGDSRRYSSKVASARRARLSFTVAQRFVDAALVEVELDTGRTHQIRVQLADLGHPVLGDPLYGSEGARRHPAALALGRLALHAARLSLELTPPISVEAPLPDDFRRALQTLASGGTSPAP